MAVVAMALVAMALVAMALVAMALVAMALVAMAVAAMPVMVVEVERAVKTTLVEGQGVALGVGLVMTQQESCHTWELGATTSRTRGTLMSGKEQEISRWCQCPQISDPIGVLASSHWLSCCCSCPSCFTSSLS